MGESGGLWHISASYYWWDLVMVYGSGAPVTKATGTQNVDFTVTAPQLIIGQQVIPEPACAGMVGVLGLGLLGRRRRES